MAWRSSGKTNAELVKNLVGHRMITSERVQRAMLAVDRAHYAPSRPYEDAPQYIGHSATVSAPHMHAHAAQTLEPYLRPGARVLDIGSGSGYLTHVLAELVKPAESDGGGGGSAAAGKVIGIDHIQALVDMANANMSKSDEGKALLASGTVRFVKADGREGWSAEAPYDAIHVGAAAKELHVELTEQLKAPGMLFIPVEDDVDESQYIFVAEKKSDGSVERRKLFAVQYVPLTDAPK